VTAADLSYFEDLVIGEMHQTPALTVTQAHVTQFLGLTGEWPDQGHGDDDVVPALLPLCLSSGLGFRVPGPPLAVLAFMGFEWRFLLPVRIGDTILSRSTTVTKRAMREGGLIVEARDVYNQRGDVAQSGRLTLLIAKRPGGSR
jgi:acyl dehydratase